MKFPAIFSSIVKNRNGIVEPLASFKKAPECKAYELGSSLSNPCYNEDLCFPNRLLSNVHYGHKY